MGRRAIYEPNKAIKNAVVGLLGRKYRLGGNGQVQGEPVDCFGMLTEYCRVKFRVNILEMFKGEDLPFYEYSENFEITKTVMKEAFKDFMDTYFLKIHVKYKLPGDMVWCDSKESKGADAFLGIYIGSQRMVVTSEFTGCIVMDTKYYNMKGAYRCLLQSR